MDSGRTAGKRGGCAFADDCSHERCRLSEGWPEDGEVECPCHGSVFDLDSGMPKNPPAWEAITVYPVTVDGRDVVIAVEDQGES